MASQTLDETVMALLSMGFEFQDTQDAIQYGKISVQDAVEWILAGKPGYATRGTSPPTLRLTDGQNTGMPSLRPDTGAPFVSPLPIPSNSTGASASNNNGASAQSPPASCSQSGANAATSSSDMDMEQQVVSRLHLTNSQQADKKNFEDKVRADLEKNMKMEKMLAKRERDRVLKEIAEDRKVSKMMKTHNPAKPAEKPSTATEAAPKATASSEASPSVSSAPSHCSIQIRLPSGRQLRKKLDCSTTLGNLWSSVVEEAERETEGYSGFMQPFPRREFTASEMNKTLQQLGLVPSGSLVLKKIDPTSPESVQEAESEVQEPEPSSEAEPMEDAPTPPLPPGGANHPFGQWTPVDRHDWGPGRNFEEEMEAAQAAEEGANLLLENASLPHPNPHPNPRWGRGRRLGHPEDEDDDMNGGEEENDGDEDDDNQAAAPQARAHGLQNALQGFMGQNMPMGWGGGGFDRHVFSGVGQRLVPEGVPGADNHIHRPVGDLAAEAAQHRLVQPDPPAAGPSVVARPIHPPSVQIDALQELCMAVVMERITHLRGSMHSLGRLPERLSEKILQDLVRQHLLDPKTLRLFCACCLRRLVLDTYNYATNDLLNAARLHPYLQVISLQSCPLISDRGIECIADLKNLKVLNLGLCKQLTNKCLKVIAGFRKLHTLSLEETGVTDSGVIEYLDTKPCLRNLNLNRTAVTSDILQHLKNLDHLETLFLEETKVVSLEGLQALQSLVSLNLASTLIQPSQLALLLELPALANLNISSTENIHGDLALQHMQGLNLRMLSLPDRHTTTSDGLAHITAFPLHSLDLTNYIHVGDKGMEHIGKISSLETLILSNTKVTDEGLQQLRGLARLRVLHLDRTRVSDVGMAIVRAFSGLEELSLSATNVTNRFLKEGMLHWCQRLTKLNLSRTHVGDKGLERLALPCLEMLNLDCTGVHAQVVDIVRANCPALRSITTANLTPVMEEMEEDEED